VAARHPECKFLRIDAEKAPFFVGRLSIRTLPALLVFEKGQVVDRLVGFDNLGPASVSSESDPDRWKTSRLQAWLARTGAIDYEPGLRDDEDSDEAESDDEAAGPTGINRGVRLGHVRRGLASLRHGDD
jgi:thiol-disulfide isomerase/thioredoxin